MRITDDALRSIRRYLEVGLGDEWEVRVGKEEGAFAYPFARVVASGPETVAGTATIQTVTLPVTVYLYETPVEIQQEADLNARLLKEKLHRVVCMGDAIDGAPWRIPLYDYDGVAAGGSSNARNASDYLSVVDYSSNVLQSPEDERLLWVAADVRVTWRRVGRVESTPTLVQDVVTTTH